MDPIPTLFDRYRDTVWSKDIEGFLSIYAPDFRGFDLWGDWEQPGLPALRQAVHDWFGGLAEDRDRVTFSDIQVTQDGNMAVASAFVRFAAISASGAELRGMDNRLTWGLRKVDGAWLVVHQHTSVPLGDEAAPQFVRPR